MAQILSDDTFAQQSGNVLIDSLVYVGLPLWTQETPSSGLTVTYAFMTTPLVPADNEEAIVDFSPLNATQQAAVRLVYATSEPLTGLTFIETPNALTADVSFGTIDITDPGVMAYTMTGATVTRDAGGLVTIDRQDYVYLDNNEYGAVLSDPLPGTLGYETILHEIGHTLGLDDTAYTQTLPAVLDNTDFTVMSYNETDTYKSNFSVLDMQTLQYLYADSGTIRSFGVIPVVGWPGVSTSPSLGATLAVG
ncbi:reprolysin-like metallopeptidase [Solidesulfovibrio sp.]|jgi:serralysin|uniref:reprolysin-like metallopeptidase n=1 Tax=Solidesulfovibrio sp. TaxID=2910990 RepID=UPI002B2127EB|nr:hypothetical protein [Solidesulfovibrio sp.]MEA4858195.1 hypothetical protein [Solidesulfovibrio sp.]